MPTSPGKKQPIAYLIIVITDLAHFKEEHKISHQHISASFPQDLSLALKTESNLFDLIYKWISLLLGRSEVNMNRIAV